VAFGSASFSSKAAPMLQFPAVDSAAAAKVEPVYYRHGVYYPYRYNGNYYRYRHAGRYYSYRYRGNYYLYHYAGRYCNVRVYVRGRYYCR
jgi:hypothetical protein